MTFEFNDFEQAFARVEESEADSPRVPPIRKAKTFKQRLVFGLVNLTVMPLVALVYLSIGAEGLRTCLPIFSTRLYRLPVPGAGVMRDFDGWDRLDLSMVMAMAMLGVASFIWYRVFKELQGFGELRYQRKSNPLLFLLITHVAGVILCADTAIFYVGLSTQSASSWSETPQWVPVAATVLYTAGLAMLGAFHSDYHHSGAV